MPKTILRKGGGQKGFITSGPDNELADLHGCLCMLPLHSLREIFSDFARQLSDSLKIFETGKKNA